MDREPEELQFLGVFGIYQESFKITIGTWRKIFTRIILSLILPLSFIYMAQIPISDAILEKIGDSQEVQDTATRGTARFNKIHAHIISEWVTFGIFKAIYLLFLLIFSLLSTSAIVYTIACIYSSKDLTFKTVSVVPKVWKRLMITFLCSFFIMVVYNFLAIFLAYLVIVLTIGPDAENATTTLTLLVIMAIPFLIGLVYISVVWQLASVVSVMEESYGIKAMRKSKALIKGKIWVSSFIFTKLQILFIGILIAFKALVIHGDSFGTWGRFCLGVFLFVLLTLLIHFALVIQTIIYFVCKSYHHENIDRSCLAEHLEVYYMGDYVPLIRDKDVQLEQFHV